MLMVASAREWELGNDTDCIELIAEWGLSNVSQLISAISQPSFDDVAIIELTGLIYRASSTALWESPAQGFCQIPRRAG
jgi:hypothetical protein